LGTLVFRPIAVNRRVPKLELGNQKERTGVGWFTDFPEGGQAPEPGKTKTKPAHAAPREARDPPTAAGDGLDKIGNLV
jgi:hypothetical protein